MLCRYVIIYGYGAPLYRDPTELFYPIYVVILAGNQK